ncbi:2-succinyl-6-hydroxy-2,4-cyclohexadiene-1-carboxylate synthase [Neobacillus pocheonensis]|uniref:2-succinyl-6-hydroxy-2, 4-cyclohexadiene-1-carboxylate synthase n=1 Tax=Neobacillus pocheonensis TaxID=363869 RepID=UPI003D292584
MKLVIDSLRYHVEVCGRGFPLVLLHGFTGDTSTWTSYCDRWGEHSELIIPDIIGHGKTDAPEFSDRYHIEKEAEDLKKILEKLGMEQVDILGYSMGGRLALTFSILFPGHVRKLILESASPGLESEAEREQRRMKDAKLANFIKEDGISAFVDYWEGISLFSTMKRLPQAVQESIRNQRLNNSSSGLANSLLGMGTGSQPSWWQNLKELSCDVLLLTGSEDKKFCGIAKRMLKEVNNGSWMVIENCGHAIHVEEPEKFGTIVSDFLVNT